MTYSIYLSHSIISKSLIPLQFSDLHLIDTPSSIVTMEMLIQYAVLHIPAVVAWVVYLSSGAQ